MKDLRNDHRFLNKYKKLASSFLYSSFRKSRVVSSRKDLEGFKKYSEDTHVLPIEGENTVLKI